MNNFSNLSEPAATLLLFNAIEPGAPFWGRYILENGALETLDKILNNYEFDQAVDVAKVKAKLLVQDLAKLNQEIKSCGGQLLIPSDQFWPKQLNDLNNPPIALIAKGKLENMKYLYEAISIVGTRNPTPYGNRIAEDFAAALVDRDFSIVSGGAYGIDASAHYGALAADGITFAVLAGGLNQIYPAGNQRLFNQIKNEGVLISEVMPDVTALPFRFLIRNRLIAALGKATVVIEAAARSGSIRTATDAAQIFRPVFAVPGRISSAQSDGCHRLIADHVAEIVTGVDDVVNLLAPMQLKF